MRAFSDFENEVIKFLVDNTDELKVPLKHILTLDKFDTPGFRWNKGDYKLKIGVQIDNTIADKYSREKKAENQGIVLVRKLHELFNCIEYLKQHYLIGEYKLVPLRENSSKQEETERVILDYDNYDFELEPFFAGEKIMLKKNQGWNENIPNFRWLNFGTAITESLDQYWETSFFTTEALREYVNDGYIWKDEQRHNKSISKANTTIYVTIGVALTSIILSIYLSCSSNKYNKAVEQQLIEINKNITIQNSKKEVAQPSPVIEPDKNIMNN